MNLVARRINVKISDKPKYFTKDAWKGYAFPVFTTSDAIF